MSFLQFSQDTARIAGLAWGVHDQFRDYIERLPDGAVTAQDGAQLLETGEAFFPLDTQLTTENVLCCVGSLQFTGHHGMLAVSVQRPWLELVNSSAALTITDPFDQSLRMALVAVEFDTSGHAQTRLTEAGTDLFMGNYQADIAFDPLRIVWTGKDT